jgi:sensor histidine kinase YesM
MKILQLKPVSFFLFLGLLILLLSGCNSKKKFPGAEKGLIDVTGWNFKGDGPVALNGEWEFYWKHLLTPRDFEGESVGKFKGYSRIPGVWRDMEGKGKWGFYHGYATYRLVIKHDRMDGAKSIYVKNPLSVCRLWINGRLLGSSGQIGRNNEEEKPEKHSFVVDFSPEGTSTEIILQLSNYSNARGGIIAPVMLGSREQISLGMTKRMALMAVLGGMFLMIGLHHLVSYLLRRVDRENLYFGAYCVVWSIGRLFGDSSGQLMNTVFPWLPWRLSIDMLLLSYALSVPLIIMFYHSLFPRKRSPFIKYFYQILGIVFITYLLITPPNALDPFLRIFINISLGIIPYLGYQFLMDIIRKEPGAKLLIPGYIALILATLNDKLNDWYVIDSITLMPYGATIFLLSYSLLISIKSSKAYSAVENLSDELETKNLQLEESVETLQENIELKSEIRERKQNAELMKIEAEKTILEKLRYQLNPHFLFNALTSIRGAILKDGKIARDMVSSLADFCRLTLSGGREEWLEVRQEMQLVELYLRIEQVRLGDYLTISSYIDTEVEGLLIPSFSVQPLVENALKYGKLTSPDELEITIVAKKDRDYLALTISNTGKWLEPEKEPGEHSLKIGLENLNNRMNRLYPNQFNFSTKEVSGRVIVQLDLPLGNLKKSERNKA